MAVQGKMLPLMKSAKEWLNGTKKGLFSMSSASNRWATGLQPRDDPAASAAVVDK